MLSAARVTVGPICAIQGGQHMPAWIYPPRLQHKTRLLAPAPRSHHECESPGGSDSAESLCRARSILTRAKQTTVIIVYPSTVTVKRYSAIFCSDFRALCRQLSAAGQQPPQYFLRLFAHSSDAARLGCFPSHTPSYVCGLSPKMYMCSVSESSYWRNTGPWNA